MNKELMTWLDNLLTEIEGLEAALADPDLFLRDPKGFERQGERLAALRDELGAAEERWLELEAGRDAAGG